MALNRTALNILLALPVLGLGAALAERARTERALPQAPAVTVADAVARRVTVDRPPFAASAEIARRPLFSESRRPPAAPEPEEDRTTPPPAFRLVGVALAGSTRRALMAVGDAAPGLLRVGESLEGWRLARITEAGVEMERGGRVVEIALDDAADGGASASASGRGASGRASGAGRKGSATPSPGAGFDIDLAEEDN